MSNRYPPPTPIDVYRGYTEDEIRLILEAFSENVKPCPGFVVDRIGVKTRGTSLWDSAQPWVSTVASLPLPGDFHAEAIEWVGLLKCLRTVRDRFAAMELGAGWGPWVVAGAHLARHKGITDLALAAVEADERHFAYLRQHFEDNGFDPDQHTLLHGAVGRESGTALWPRLVDSRNDWGAAPVTGTGPDYRGLEISETIEVTLFGLSDLVRMQDRWDLVHIDVQGAEGDLCDSAMEELTGRAAWTIVGTHSRVNEGDLLRMFHQAGWKLENEKPCRFEYDDRPCIEAMVTADGTQVWRNPRLAD